MENKHILRLCIFILIIVFIFIIKSKLTVENWQDYILKPYNYMLSGSDPLYFYRYDRFRRPYRDGFKFYQSYPSPHLSSFP